MINTVSIKNFKSLREVRVDLERFTIFVGPNASGKSSILQSVDFLCRTFGMDHPEQLDAQLIRTSSRGSDGEIEFVAECYGQFYRYQMPSPSLRQSKQSNSGRHCSATSLDSSDWQNWKPETPGGSPLPRSVLLRLEASNLMQANPNSHDLTSMSPEGKGLHSALASMALNDPDSWQALQDHLRRIIPTIRRLRHTRTSTAKQPPALLFDTVGADSLPADQVSEGTLLVLGLLAALHAPDRPNLVLLDDLDQGLHPKAQQELIGLLRGLLETYSDLQILASTHSPYLLDCMEVGEVRMTFLEEGQTVCAALTSHPKFKKWKDEMTPGEMWSLFGEKWITEGVSA